MTKLKRRPPALLLPVLAALLAAGPPGGGWAKDVPKPVVMLLLDTSGSMEYSVDALTTEGDSPICHSEKVEGFPYERSRWAVAAEVLTGTFNDYWCSYDDRLDDPLREDYAYEVPHIVFHGTEIDGDFQQKDGLLDLYSDAVKFGLMTFDVKASVSTGGDGSFSYGPNTLYNGAAVNWGARNAAATWGALVSPSATDDPADMRQTAQDVQSQILASLPYGPTPSQPMMEDALYFFQTDPNVKPFEPASGEGDPYSDCRQKFVVLITDGQPNRPATDVTGSLSAVSAAKLWEQGIPVYVIGFQLPVVTFPVVEKIAKYGGTEHARLVEDQHELTLELGKILLQVQGKEPSRIGTLISTRTQNMDDKQYQFHAALGSTTLSGIDKVGLLDQLVFRCDPSCTPVNEGTEAEKLDDVGLCESFSISDALNNRLDERNILTHLSGVFIPFDDENSDITPDVLDIPTSGELQSLDPIFLPDGRRMQGPPLGDASDPAVREEYARQLIRLISADPISRRKGIAMGAIFHSNPATQPNHQYTMSQSQSYNKWIRRAEIYTRPTPLFVGTHDGQLHAFRVDRMSTLDPNDYGTEMWSFIPKHLLPKLSSLASGVTYLLDGSPVAADVRLFKENVVMDIEEEADRWRSVVVSGYRDGGRGYFSLDVTDPANPAFMWEISGEERCFNVFGTPPVCEPTDAYMRLGLSYSNPAVGSIFWTTGGVNEERGVAIFGGGKAIPEQIAPECDCPVTKAAIWHRHPSKPPEAMCVPFSALPAHLGHGDTLVSCGAAADPPGSGKTLYIVNLESGDKMQEFCNACGNVEDTNTTPGNTELLDCPLSGHVAAFDTSSGALITRAFIGDDCGQIWRLDLSSPSPALWKLSFFHDAYNGLPIDSPLRRPVALTPSPAVGEERGRLLLIYGTGDPDLGLLGGQQDRVYSLREFWNGHAIEAKVNWELRLQDGEVFTSPAVIFDRVAYFTTQAAGGGMCATGTGKLWGIDYDGESDATDDDLVSALDLDGDPLTQDVTDFIEFEDSQLLGVQVVQRPACFDTPGDYTPWTSGPNQGAPPLGMPGQFGGGSIAGGMSFGGASGGGPQLVAQTGESGVSSPGMQPPEGGGAVQTGNKAVMPLASPSGTIFSTSWGLVFD